MTGMPTISRRSRFLLGPHALLAVLRLALGALRALDASTLKVLWTSDQRPDGSDRLGNVAKFTPVTIANGKVYVPTFSNKLVVYGLKKPCRTTKGTRGAQ